MKKIFFFLMFLVFASSAIKLEADTTKTGRFWEFISDPSLSTATADRTAAINWMKDNFDKHNIPLVSTIKLINSSTDLFFGIDSAFKHSPVELLVRDMTWRNAVGVAFSETNRTLAIYWPWWRANDNPIGFSGTGSGSTFATNKNAIDAAEAQGGVIKSPLPITITSEIKDGFIVGTMVIKNEGYTDALKADLQIQMILAEGYHSYPVGTGGAKEEHYFIPRKFFYDEFNLGGAVIISSNIPAVGNSLTRHFKFPIDKKWNPDYLYVIGLVERYRISSNNMAPQPRVLYDVAVDRVVNVKNAPSHTPVKLVISTVNETDKFNKVKEGSVTSINYNIVNPTNKTVRAHLYIDSTTSVLDGWKIDLATKSVVLPAGGNTTVKLTATAPNIQSAASIDLAVLPHSLDANTETAVFSNQLVVFATDKVRAIVLDEPNTPSWGQFWGGVRLSSYDDDIAFVPVIYHTVIPPNAFEGYIFVKATSISSGMFGPAPDNYPINGNVKSGLSPDQLTAMAKYLTLSELNFLNAAISQNRHLALFIDKSADYNESSLSSSAEKSAYSTLFNSFGVTHNKTNLKVHTNSESLTAIPFDVSGTTNDALGRIPGSNEPIVMAFGGGTHVQNSYKPPYNVEWNVAQSKATKIFYYDDQPATNAIIKTTHGSGSNQQRMLLAGIGLNGLYSTVPFGHLIENLVVWWFGVKPIYKPVINVSPLEIDFGAVGTSQPPQTRRIIVRNDGPVSEGNLRLKLLEIDFNYEGVYDIVKAPTQIPPGASDTIIVSFKPLTEKKYNDPMLRIYHNDPEKARISVSLKGEGFIDTPPEPELFVDGEFAFIDFGTRIINTTSQFKEILVWNAGDADLIIYSINFTADTDTDVFELQDANFTSIPPQTPRVITLVFKPVKVGEFDGGLVIKSNSKNDNNSSFLIEFTGEVEDDGSVEEKIAQMFSCLVSPNPSDDFINIDFNVLGELNRSIKMNIIDATGKLITEVVNDSFVPGNYKRTINVKHLSSGMYYLEYVIDNLRSATLLNIVR